MFVLYYDKSRYLTPFLGFSDKSQKKRQRPRARVTRNGVASPSHIIIIKEQSLLLMCFNPYPLLNKLI